MIAINESAVNQIVKRMRVTTSQVSTSNTTYRCPICSDTGWVLNENNIAIVCQCEKINHTKRLWKKFGVDISRTKTIAQYEPYDQKTKSLKNKAINYIKNFDDIKNQRENGFAVLGQPGAGKTHVIIAIGVALLNRKNSVSSVYMNYIDSMRELKSNAMDDEYYIRLQNRYTQASLLIIDDLFKDKIRHGQVDMRNIETDLKHIFPIINNRYFNYLPTVVSSECTPEILMSIDEAFTRRIIETCCNNITIFDSKKNNYNMQKYS